METDLRQNKWIDNEKELLLSNKLIPLTTVYFHKETENEIVTCFKNSDNTYTLMITNNITNVTVEKTFNDFDKMIENNSFKKLSKNNNIKEW